MDAELEAWKAGNSYMETSAIQAEIRAILSNPTVPSQETWDRYHKLRNWVNVPFPERFKKLNKSRPFVDEAFADELKNTVFQHKVKSMPPEVQKMIAAPVQKYRDRLRRFKRDASRDQSAYMNPFPASSFKVGKLSPEEKKDPAFVEAAMQGVVHIFFKKKAEFKTFWKQKKWLGLAIRDILRDAPPSILSNKKLMVYSAQLTAETFDYVSENLKTDIDVVCAASFPSPYKNKIDGTIHILRNISNDPKLLAEVFNRASKQFYSADGELIQPDSLPWLEDECRKNNLYHDDLLCLMLRVFFAYSRYEIPILQSKEYILQFMSALHLQFDNTGFYKQYSRHIGGNYEHRKTLLSDPDIIAAFSAKGVDISQEN